jgi:hypothetical protein
MRGGRSGRNGRVRTTRGMGKCEQLDETTGVWTVRPPERDVLIKRVRSRNSA